MATRNENITPFRPYHVGEFIRGTLDEVGMKQKDLSARTGVLPSHLNELLRGKRSLSAELAVKIGAVLGIEPYVLMNVQAQYDCDVAYHAAKADGEIVVKRTNLFQERLACVPDDVRREVDLCYSVSDRIAGLLESRGMSQRSFAKAMNRTEAEVSVWLSGGHNFTLRTLARISSFFGEDIVAAL